MISCTVCASHAPGMERDVAGTQGKQFRRGLDAARDVIDAFGPDLVVLFGGDHRRAFAQVTPAFALVRGATLVPEGTIPGGPLDIPEDIVDDLAEALLADDFDIAMCRGISLDHAFGQPLHRLLTHPASTRVVPIVMNCASPPLPKAERVIKFGVRVGAFFAARTERVLFIGTGGLSHNPPTLVGDRHDLTEFERRELREAGLEEASKLIKPGWDRRFLDAIERWDVDKLTLMTDGATAEAGVGANEVRTWLAATAAGATQGLRTLVYEPVAEWITGMAVATGASPTPQAG